MWAARISVFNNSRSGFIRIALPVSGKALAAGELELPAASAQWHLLWDVAEVVRLQTIVEDG